MTKEHRVEFSWEKFDAMLQFKPTKKVCADYLEISEDTIENRIKEKYQCTFTEYRDRKMGGVKIKLQQKAIQDALGGNTVLMIFCLKNLCGWADRVDQAIEVTSVPAFKIVEFKEDD